MHTDGDARAPHGSGARSLLARREHRPFPLPPGPWVLSQVWRDLAFIHWPVAPGVLRAHVPPELEIDSFEGDAYVGLTPFLVADSRLRGRLALPGTRRFLEMNLRTYVRSGDRGGIFFFSLDAASPLAVLGARAVYRLPYRTSTMRAVQRDGWIEYESHRRGEAAELVARYRPVGDAYEPAAGTLEHFLTERYALFSTLTRGSLIEGDIQHAPWRIRPATIEIERQSVTAAAGFDVGDQAPLVHVAERQDTLIWPPRFRRAWVPAGRRPAEPARSP